MAVAGTIGTKTSYGWLKPQMFAAPLCEKHRGALF